MARVRVRPNQKYHNSLMPFCRKCPPAHYQTNYNQVKCLPCPVGMTSPRGAISIDNCFEEKRHICDANSAICGPHGICMPENENLHLYSCLCEDGYTGNAPFFAIFCVYAPNLRGEKRQMDELNVNVCIQQAHIVNIK